MEIASAVRLPTPEPIDSENLPPGSGKRKRSPPSRSPSPRRQPSPPRRSSPPPDDGPRNSHRDRHVPTGRLSRVMHQDREERQRQYEIRNARQTEANAEPVTEDQKQAAAKKEYDALLNKRSGGVYIPPARLRALQAQITDRKSKEFQRMAWEALKKSINGLINKVNISNIKYIVPELFGENLVRGRGLFCRSIMKAQASSLPFTPIFAATAAIVNTKLPQVGELLVKRLVVSFRKAFKRNDKAVCISTTTFLAHLVNQQVAHESLAAQILLLLLHKPTDDSVEIAVNLVKECGQHLEEMNGPIAVLVFDQFRSILHEATDLEKRTQYMIEVLFQIRKDRWKDYPAIREELDLIEEEDQITHQVELDGDQNTQDTLNIFKFDPEYEENEEAYKKLKAEILGEASGSEDEEDGSDESSEEEEEEAKDRDMEIKDQTNTDLVNLRRSIYLTIKSSGTFEEACHKLMRINLPAGQEEEMPSMIIECASQERTFDKFYGNIGERFCKLNRLWQELFQDSFIKYYETIHRFETNRLRIIAQFFGYILGTDAIGWQVLSVIHMNEDETTSSSRIFIKILFEELSQAMGINRVADKLKDEMLQPYLGGIFPKDDPKNTRFSINFFTAIGMGALTEDMREHLRTLQQSQPAITADDHSDSESVSSYSSYSSYSRSRSATPRRESSGRGRRDHSEESRRSRHSSVSRSPPRRRIRRRSNSRTPSVSSRSVSPSPRNRRSEPSRRSRRESTHSRSPSRNHSPSPVRNRRGSRNSSSLDSRSPPPPVREHRGGRDRSFSETPPRRVHRDSVEDERRDRRRDRSYSSHSR